MAVGGIPPGITSQPASVATNVTAEVGFLVAATGTAPLIYQWVKDGVLIDAATNASLTLVNVQTNQAGNYSVVITNAYGSVTSSVALLTVNRLVQTITFGALPGKRVDDGPFSLTATTSSGLPVIFSSSVTSVATVSGSTVTLTGIGSTTITASQAGNATYLPATSVNQALAVGGIPPGITSQPASATVISVGSSATFSVTATGAAPLTYQWRKDGVALSGAIGATLTLVPTNRAAGGAYSVVVTNAFGSVTSNPALLRVMVTQRMERPELTGGAFKLRFGDVDGAGLTEADKNGFTLQWSTNLVEWFDLTNATRSVVGGKVELEDADAAGKARRFYRVLER